MKPTNNVMYTGAIAEIAAGGSITKYINIPHCLSNLNRKAYHQFSRDGHLKNYGMTINVFNMTNATTTISTAQQGYATYNAARAWHFARLDRLRDAGYSPSDMGYGGRLRVALDATHSGYNQYTSTSMLKPQHLTTTAADRGEWDFSDIIITPPQYPGMGSPEGEDLFDAFILHLTGDHVVDPAASESAKFQSVGMIQAWTENRRGWAAPADESVTQIENPLAFTRDNSVSSRRLVEEVADEQKQAPPYSNEDDDDAESPFAKLQVSGMIESAFPQPTTNDDGIVCPGGLAKIHIANNHTAAQYPFAAVELYELD